MKYEVGDAVRMKSKEELLEKYSKERYNSIECIKNMDFNFYANQKAIIMRIVAGGIDWGPYFILDIDMVFAWEEEDFTLILNDKIREVYEI